MGKFKLARGRTTRILVLNPNSSQSMTEGMKTVIDSVELPSSTEIHTYTGPTASPASIDDDDGIQASTYAVLADLAGDDHEAGRHDSSRMADFDGIVVACFSVHPLTRRLHAVNRDTTSHELQITGIFEASILTAMSLVQSNHPSSHPHRWGIVTTGTFWEAHLTEGVAAFLGVPSSALDPSRDNAITKFAGVQSTGLNASDFHHGVDPAVVRSRLKAATTRLLECGGSAESPPTVRCIVMGCAGMAGLEDTIREAAAERFGDEFAYAQLHVVDGVRAGVAQVEQMVRNQRLRPGLGRQPQ